MRKGDNREMVGDCVRISRKKGESLQVAGASMFNRFRVSLRNKRKRKNQDYQSVKARFQMSVESLGYSLTAISTYARGDECTSQDEHDLFWGAIKKCLKYMYSKHRRAIDGILNQLLSFSKN